MPDTILGEWLHPSRPYVTSREVSIRLGFTLRAFQRRKATLDGFPPPAHGRLWLRAQVDAWLLKQEQGQPDQDTAEAMPPTRKIINLRLEKLRRNGGHVDNTG